LKVNAKAIAKAVIVLFILTILPFIGLRVLPPEFARALLMQSGFDVLALINRVAVIGVVLTILILLRGHVEKSSSKGLAVSTVWKGFWLFFVFFLLGAGYPETLGLAILGGKSAQAENIVVFDFRLFAALSTVIVAAMIVRSVLQFKEAKAAQNRLADTKQT
jgi:hypothetical protein